MDARAFHVEPIDYTSGLAELRAVRETVFVLEQQVPIEEEWDALDPLCRHVIARDRDGKPIGTTPKTSVSVAPGTHTVVFINTEQDLKKSITVNVAAGETKPAVAKLREE